MQNTVKSFCQSALGGSMKNILKYKTYDYSSLDKGIAVDKNPNVVSSGYSEKCFNFSYKDGGLRDGIGINEIKYYPYGSNIDVIYSFPETLSPVKITQFPFYNEEMSYDDRMIIFICEDGSVYGWKPNASSEGLLTLPFEVTKDTILLNYVFEDQTFLYAINDGVMYIYNMTSKHLEKIQENVPLFEEICFYKEHVFGRIKDKKHTLWCSAQKNPANWLSDVNTYSFIDFNDLKGNCLRLISTIDGLYVFREYGISKIIFNENEGVFETEEVCKSTGKIFGNSIQECGDSFVYITTDGMYTFNGISSKKITTRMEDIIRRHFTHFSLTAYNNGKYYVALKINYDDSIFDDGHYQNNTLIELDLADLTENILRGVGIVELSSINEVNSSFMFAIINTVEKNKVGVIGRGGKIFGTPLKKYWRSVESDYGLPHKKKIISRFFIVSKSDIKITFHGDNKSYYFQIKGSENVQILKPNLSAYRFSVEIESSSADNDITNLKALVGYYD